MPKGEYLQYGGQAILEGVMMRSPHYFSIACRAPNGEIVLTTEALEKTWIGRQKWLKLPFLRGSLAILDAMGLGAKAMKFAGNVQMAPQYQVESEEKEKAPSQKVQDITIGLTLVFSLIIAFGIFNYLPNVIAEYSSMALANKFGGAKEAVTSAAGQLPPPKLDYKITNTISEVVKALLFFGYIWGISFLPDIAEVFKYHGAEHKAINTMEAEQDLEIANCKTQTRLHPRCGTSFAIVVLIVGFIVFTFVPRYLLGESVHPMLNVTVRFLVELVILPLIAGISYEAIRLAGKFRSKAIVNVLFKPGLMTQYLTTKEPNEGQIEVALEALKAVVHAETTGELRTSG